MMGDIGYVRLYSFTTDAGKEIADAIKQFDDKKAKGYILDLRDNPGGLLASGVDVASLFVKPGVIVRVDQRNRPEEVDMTSVGQMTDKPLVLLVNANSASASEIVSGALQDYKRAKLVGVKTYGKGSVQTVKELANGAAIKFTIAHYLTPNKRSIDRIGLDPDVKVPMDEKLQADKKTNVQLQKALEVVRGEAR